MLDPDKIGRRRRSATNNRLETLQRVMKIMANNPDLSDEEKILSLPGGEHGDRVERTKNQTKSTIKEEQQGEVESTKGKPRIKKEKKEETYIHTRSLDPKTPPKQYYGPSSVRA
ncbi:hypothetical protein WH47_11438 [Habropoda laboriosa]|uniref:Uncharacterized protein n=1 Tax=Habropoda laboriosa TaxID=597456 RepID=A0A0L7R9Z6_9HYME|nr:hypothetical protein WH47_11438 [Habropoda laboriosa]